MNIIDHAPTLPRQRDLFLHQKIINGTQRIHSGAQETTARFVRRAAAHLVGALRH